MTLTFASNGTSAKRSLPSIPETSIASGVAGVAVETQTTLVIIDSGVEDYSVLAAGVLPNIATVILDSNQDGVAQITKALQAHPHTTSLHIVSHGAPGCLYLGNTQLSLETIEHYAWDIQSWFSHSYSLTSLPSILLYSCHTAQGSQGQLFINHLSQLAAANIAASTRSVGSPDFGGDWTLDITTSDVELPFIFQPWVKTLPIQLNIVQSDDFDPGIDGSQWTSINNGFANTNAPGSNGNSLWFNGSTERSATTKSLNTIGGGVIKFDLRIADGVSPWENADAGEDVVLEYSTNGGSSWTLINQYDVDVYITWSTQTLVIPVAACTSSTQFRWRQISNSGSGFDNWALDNVSIDSGTPAVIGGTTTGSVTEDSSLNASGTLTISDPDAGEANFVPSGTTGTYGFFNVNAAGAWSYAANNSSLQSLKSGQSATDTFTVSSADGTTQAVTITINGMNDAPNFTSNATLAAVAEDTTNPSGSLITTLFNGAFSNPDAGSSLSGVAVVGNAANPTTEGQWQYSTNGGTNWFDIGAVAEGATALALPTSSSVRFVAVANYNGTPPVLTVRAVDNSYAGSFTNGATRQTIDTSLNGGTTAIAASTNTISTSITSVNDNPVVSASQLFAITQNDKVAENLPYGPQSLTPADSAFLDTQQGSVIHNSWTQIGTDGAQTLYTITWQFSTSKTLQQRFADAVSAGEPVTWTVISASQGTQTYTGTWQFSNSAGDLAAKFAGSGFGFSSDDGIWGAANGTLNANGTSGVGTSWGHGNFDSSDSADSLYLNGVNTPIPANFKNLMYISVNSINKIATEDSAAFSLNLLAGASDPDGDTLNVSNLSLTSGNTAGITVNGNDLTVDPNAYNSLAVGESEVINYGYNITDGNGGSTAQTAKITIAGVNDAPTGTATAPLLDGTEDTLYTINATDLLQGFSDVDTTDTLSVSALTAANGTLVDNADGTYSFTPAANYNGTVNLNYNVIDGNGGSVAATQSFSLGSVNDAPTSSVLQTQTFTFDYQDDGYSFTEDGYVFQSFQDYPYGYGVNGSGMTYTRGTNNSAAGGADGAIYRVDGQNFSLQSFSASTYISGTSGMAAVNVLGFDNGVQVASSLINYTSTHQTFTFDSSWNSIDEIRFDGQSSEYFFLDNLVVTGVVANGGNSTGTVTEQGTPSGNLTNSGIISFSDVDLGDVHLISPTGIPIGSVLGSLTAVKDADTTGTGTGGQLTWTYSVNAAAVEYLATGQTKVESFTIDIDDQNGGILTKQIDVTITGTNDAPTGTASAALANGAEDAIYTIIATDLLQGFSDVDTTDTLSVSALTATNGTLVNNNNGTYSFTPTANYNGTVSLNYNVIDGNGGSVAATQSFSLGAANDAPTGTASATLANGTEDTAYTINATDLLQGFSDVDTSDTLFVSALSATNGTLVNNNNGTYSFTPTANYNGTVNLSYNVIDGHGGSVAATQSFSLGAVADVTSVGATTLDGAYNAGEAIAITVTFDEIVNVADTPQLTLETGTTDAIAIYNSGSGTNTLTFFYTVGANETSIDLDYLSTTALSLNGGSIRNASNIDANLVLPVPGNTNSLGANKNLVIDTTAPTIPAIASFTTDSGMAGDNITNDTTPSFSGTAEADSTVSLTLDGASAGMVMADKSGNWTYTPGILSEGTHTLSAIATDAVGNSSAASPELALTIDTKAPTTPTGPDLTTASDLGVSSTDNRTSETKPTFTGAAEANSSVELFAGIQSLGITTTDATGNWSFTVPTALAAGNYNITAQATDVAGNTSASSPPLMLTVQTVGSTVTTLNITPNVRDSNVGTISLEFSEAITNFDLTDLTLTHDGVAVSLVGATLTSQDNRTWILGLPIELTATDGRYQLSVTTSNITNTSGNALTSGASDTWLVGHTGTALEPINFLGGRRGIHVRGTSRSERFRGTFYNDVLKGMGGNDVLIAGYSKAQFGVDRLYGGDGNDILISGNGKDLLYGEGGSDRLLGGKGNDYLDGGSGSDRLLGGNGNDVLVGGMGSDTLSGMAGKDTFVCNTLTEGTDIVTDFNGAEDLIDLRGILRQPEFGGDNMFARFTQYIQLQQAGSSTEVQVDTDGNGAGQAFTTVLTLENTIVSTVNSRNFVIA